MPMDSMECIQCRVIDAQYETNWPLCQLHALFDCSTHAQCLFFSADAHQIQHTLYTTMTGEESNNEKYSIEKHTKDTQTQTFYILCFTIQSFQLNSRLINGFFFCLFFLISFQLWVLHFRSNCFMVSTLSQPYNSTCCSIEKRTAQLNSTLLSENGGIHVKGAACVVLLQQTQKN